MNCTKKRSRLFTTKKELKEHLKNDNCKLCNKRKIVNNTLNYTLLNKREKPKMKNNKVETHQEEETKETHSEEDLKQIYHYAKTVELKKYDTKKEHSGIRIKTTKDKQKVDKLTLCLSVPDIKVTWKPRKEKKNEELDKDGFLMESGYSEMYTVTEFKTLYPEYVELAKLSLKKDVTILLSYTEKEFYNEKEKEVETYYFMRDWTASKIWVQELMSNDAEMEKRKKWQEEHKNQSQNLAEV